MTEGATYDTFNLPPLKLKPRNSKRKHKLPKGWRWLEIGEYVKAGDKCCDPRVQPVTIIISGAWIMDKGCHPVRRKIKEEKS